MIKLFQKKPKVEINATLEYLDAVTRIGLSMRSVEKLTTSVEIVTTKLTRLIDVFESYVRDENKRKIKQDAWETENIPTPADKIY